MAENLRKLVSSETLQSMHDKLESWLRDYNVSRGGTAPGGFDSLQNLRPGFLRAGSGRPLHNAQEVGIPNCDPVPDLNRGKEGRALVYW